MCAFLLPIRYHKEDSSRLPKEVRGAITLKTMSFEPGTGNDGNILGKFALDA